MDTKENANTEYLKQTTKDAFDASIVIKELTSQTFEYLDKMNPLTQLMPLMGKDGLLSKDDGKVKIAMNKWLDLADEVFEQGRALPVDTMAIAANVAKLLRENNAKSKGASKTE